MRARVVRRIHFWHWMFWLGPGAAVAFALRNSIALANFFGWFSIVLVCTTNHQSSRTEQAVRDNGAGN